MANDSLLIGNLNSSIESSSPFQTYVWPCGIFFFPLGIAAIFGNAMLLVALRNSAELRKNRCNILVGNLAFADLIVSTAFLFPAGVMLLASAKEFGYFSMSQELCFYISIPHIMSVDAAAVTVLAIGIDRTISLTKPMFYKSLTIRYNCIIIALSWFAGLVNVILGWLAKDPNMILPICSVPTALVGNGNLYWSNLCLVINVLVIITYTIAYLKAKNLAKFQSSANELTLRNNRLLTSLCIFTCVYISSSFSAYIIIFLLNYFSGSPSVIFHFAIYSGLFVVITNGCSFYIYYARSEEYRKVFQNILNIKSSQISTSVLFTNSSPA